MCSVVDEVIGPDMVGPFCPQPDAGSVAQPKPPPLRLPGRYLQPLAPPKALDPLVVDLPAGLPKQGGDPAIAVSAILTGQLDHVRDQPGLVITSTRDTTLRGAVLAEHPAGPALRYPETPADMIDATAAARGAQKFPLAASDNICLSRVRSEIARRSRSFSFSSSFSRRS